MKRIEQPIEMMEQRRNLENNMVARSDDRPKKNKMTIKQEAANVLQVCVCNCGSIKTVHYCENFIELKVL